MRKILVIFPSTSGATSIDKIRTLMYEIDELSEVIGITEKDILTEQKIKEQNIIFCFTSGINILQTMENFAKALKTGSQKVITAGFKTGNDLMTPITKEKLLSVIA